MYTHFCLNFIPASTNPVSELRWREIQNTLRSSRKHCWWLMRKVPWPAKCCTCIAGRCNSVQNCRITEWLWLGGTSGGLLSPTPLLKQSPQPTLVHAACTLLGDPLLSGLMLISLMEFSNAILSQLDPCIRSHNGKLRHLTKTWTLVPIHYKCNCKFHLYTSGGVTRL